MLILGEGLTLCSAVGAVCILCGVYWAAKKEMKHTDAGRSLGKSLHRNRDFLLDREKYLPNFVSE